MPIPGLSLPDDTLFDGLNGVMVAYAALILFPRWRLTPALTMAFACLYSMMYGLLLAHRLFVSNDPLPEVAFDRLNAIVALFADRATLFAGWTHYIAFDLFVARFIVMDSQANGMPHMLVVWTIPLTLFAGPVGLIAYMATRNLWSWACSLHSVWERVALPERSTKARFEMVVRPGSTWHEQMLANLGSTWYERVLSVLYCTVSALAGYMVFWIFVFPSSSFVGNWELHDRLLKLVFKRAAEEGAPLPVPLSLVMKYDGHRAVQLLHVLPAAIWSAAIPFQLHPGFRKRHRYHHRVSGYAFCVSSVMMMVGLALIDYRGLEYFHMDFPSIPTHQNMSLIGLDRPLGLSHSGFFRICGVWFSVSLLVAIGAACRRQLKVHERFVYRHIASGIWVALQRLYIIVVRPSP